MSAASETTPAAHCDATFGPNGAVVVQFVYANESAKEMLD
jgi:hypothetical protein